VHDYVANSIDLDGDYGALQRVADIVLEFATRKCFTFSSKSDFASHQCAHLDKYTDPACNADKYTDPGCDADRLCSNVTHNAACA